MSACQARAGLQAGQLLALSHLQFGEYLRRAREPCQASDRQLGDVNLHLISLPKDIPQAAPDFSKHSRKALGIDAMPFPFAVHHKDDFSG